MSIDNLKSGLPDYAKDLKLNIGTLVRGNVLTEQQLWGTLLSTAAATAPRLCCPKSPTKLSST